MPSSKLTKPFYTTFELAELCNVSMPTIRNWQKEKRIEGFRTLGGHRRYKREEVNKLLRRLENSGHNNLNEWKILVVDDDFCVRNGIAKRLKKEGYRIFEAEDGMEAGMILARQKPDMMILDLIMPQLDGFSVIRHVLADPELQEMEIIVLSGFLDQEKKEALKALGIVQIFEKPINGSLLVDKIESIRKGVSLC